MGKNKIAWAVVLLIALTSVAVLVFAANKDTWFPLEKRIAASIMPNDPNCGEQFPLRVTLVNNSGRTITRTGFKVSVRRAGYSSELESTESSTDKILRPGEQFDVCLERPGERMNKMMEGNVPGLFRDPYKEYPNELEYFVEVDHAEAE